MKLISSWSVELKRAAYENRFPYLYEKARLFELLGKDKYRKLDAFNQPDELLTDEEIEVVRRGCLQILEGKGFTADQPFENLGVSGFYALMRLFHFEKIDRMARPTTINGLRGIVDQITFKHVIDDFEVKYFNFCTYRK